MYIEHAQEMMVKTLMIEHFGVHHKRRKPTLVVGHQWKYQSDNYPAHEMVIYMYIVDY
jgi:hypothetical protein